MAVALVVVAVIGVGALAVAPIILTAVRGQSKDWNELSDIATTYGAAAALLSVLALAGVAVSLVFQARETKASRDQALRSLHVDLLRMAMDDEVYRRCWGDFFDSADPEEQRAQLYVNMIFSHWELMFELNALTEVALREAARIVLAGSDGRRFWEGSRDIRAKSASTRRKRRFHEIVDGEYLRLPPPTSAPTPGPSPPPGSNPPSGAG
ncbi:hypothetical protein BCD48_35640 [Pseudofrankia sp. BMG5.36]|nr:hypothetical protein BCD48_35640 [Pseudofrankia sp. BMG5.36]